MHHFLASNRAELIERCKAKVALRPTRNATPGQLSHGVPLFLDQLTRTLVAEGGDDDDAEERSVRISGASGGDGASLSEMGIAATIHGKELMELGYTVDQVVHDYGDLCQAITDLAVESDAPFSIDSFRTLNRCLDNAIADAVTEFATQRDLSAARRQSDEERLRLGFLAHELRNHLHIAKLAFAALESGRLAIGGSTGSVLKRSLDSLGALIEHSLEDVRNQKAAPSGSSVFALTFFLADAANVAKLYAARAGCSLRGPNADPTLGISGNRELLSAALGNLLQNAFKFTKSGSEVVLHARAADDRLLIDVEDRCGGLPAGSAEALFVPFRQGFDDRRGLGLGLSIARQSIAADGGVLTVRNMPGKGCVFTIDLPLQTLA